ncbi:hypothetical protein DYD21_02830 [Rhodohalobacter sp. SW132]|uniref:hypothetical protein n=1 Tax=Rhodohalobacter sp. SW132 TaxID=2293433 RepID=UPI000E288066|nr:hypothetical protein [Rhodohalobacter sp. SW132]REL38904.1 hypothetical protein DYD21_02830 [Rhodohalobacter sp. SW132]
MKNYSVIAFFLWVPLFISCSGEGPSDDQLIYSNVPEIDFELIMEAGESENYFPAQLNELYVASDGSILVSDWGSVTLEQFSASGEHLQTVATEGGGPGELSSFFFIKDAGQGQLMVEHQGARRDIFGPDENSIFRYQSTRSTDQNDQYGNNVIGYRPENEYYVTPRNVIRDIQSLVTNPEDYRSYPIQIADFNGEIVRDSLQLLQNPNPHIVMMNGGFRINTIPYRNTDRFLVRPDGTYLVARPGLSTIEFYDLNHSLDRTITLDVEDRPVTAEDLDYAFRDTDRDDRRGVEPRVHDLKPPFLDAWVSENKIWLHTDNREEGKEFVILDLQGNPVGRFLLSEFDDVKEIINNTIYSIHKDPEVGDSIRVYEIAV